MYAKTVKRKPYSLVGRAVAIKGMQDATREMAIRVHVLEDGEQAGPVLGACISVIAIICGAMSDDKIWRGSPELSMLRGARSALEQCAKRGGTWRKADAMAVDKGLHIAVDMCVKLKPEAIGKSVAHQSHGGLA